MGHDLLTSAKRSSGAVDKRFFEYLLEVSESVTFVAVERAKIFLLGHPYVGISLPETKSEHDAP